MAANIPSKPDARSANGTPLYRKVCAGCGAERLVDKRRIGKKCNPCALKDRATHGLSKHPLYRKLNNLRARCEYQSATNYQYYGGRGIGVCREWVENPAAFVEWVLSNGWRPGLEVDRIDVDGDYSPENCRLLTHKENSQRTRRIKTTPEQAARVKELLHAGASVKECAATVDVPYMTAWHIKNSGTWSNA